MTRLGSKVGWKWKWPEKCQKIEIILIWFISNTNNVKSCKKFNETTQTANFTGFLCYHLLNRSYCCSKSGQIWRFSLESGVVKQKYALKNFLKTDPLEKSFKIGFWNFQENLFWEKNLSEYLFFWMTPLSKKILRFDPTLSSNNSGLKNDSIKTTTFSETAGRQLSSYPDFSTSVTSKKIQLKAV